MEDDTATDSMELEPAPASWAQSTEPVPPRPEPADEHPYVETMRKLAGRTERYDGPIIAITQGWVSRDTRAHVFAARFLDFAMITDEHLMFCSTGFFTRRPRRRVFLEPFNRLGLVPRGPEPYRTLRIIGDFNSPLLLELRDDDNSIAFANELLARSQTGRDFLTARSLPPADERVLPPVDDARVLDSPVSDDGVLDVEAEPEDPSAIAAPDTQPALPAPDDE